MSPVVINYNVIDIVVAPGARAGDVATSIELRARSGST